jgi:hypothetical protein
MNDPLEARISKALSAEHPVADNLQALLREIETAARNAGANAKRYRDQARDLATPDPFEALRQAQKAELIGDRLDAAVPRLQMRLAEAIRDEHRARGKPSSSGSRRSVTRSPPSLPKSTPQRWASWSICSGGWPSSMRKKSEEGTDNATK